MARAIRRLRNGSRLLPLPLAEATQHATFKPMWLLLEMSRWVQQGKAAG